MSITLVNPSNQFCRGMIPLGIVSIATHLRNHKFCDTSVLDANCQDIYREFRGAEITGVSAVSQDIGQAVKFAREIRPRTKLLVLGGVHVTTARELPEPFDIGVIGEGEETMLELAQLSRYDEQSLAAVDGICYRRGGELVFTSPRELVKTLDQLPTPDRSLVNMDYYLQPRQLIPFHWGRTLSLLSSRGCPFNCVFCSTRVHWKRFRAFSAERVVGEIDMLVRRYRVEIIHIFDDLFVADGRRLRLIVELLAKTDIPRRVKFMCLARSDLLDDEMMTLLKEMNVVVIGIGMESGSDSVLSYLKRDTTTVAENRRAIAIAGKCRVSTMGSFMVGNPEESETELLKTLQFVRGYRYSPYFAPTCYISTAFPGTEFWRYAKAKGLSVDQFDRVVMDIPKRRGALLRAPLLTNIPLQRFFKIIRRFAKETNYGILKNHVLHPHNRFGWLYVVLGAMWIEKNPITGLVEAVRLYRRLKKLA